MTQRCRLVQSGVEVAVFHEGLTHRFGKPQGKRTDDLAAGGDQVVSMMPGIVKQVLVVPGQEVKADEPMVSQSGDAAGGSRRCLTGVWFCIFGCETGGNCAGTG